VLTVFLLSLFFVNIVHAQDEVDLSEFPTRLSEMLGINEFAGELLASTLLMALFLFPAMMIARGSANQTYIILFVGFSVMGICIALGWLPYFMLLVIVLIVALMFAGKMREWIGGK